MPAGRGSLNPTTNSVGYTAKLVTVSSVTADGKTALTVDRQNTQTEVSMMVQRSKGPLPQPTETWLITQDLGSWTFAAFVGSSAGDFSAGDGTGITVAAVAPADPALNSIWMDSAAGNALFQWNGVSWTPIQLGGAALAPGSVTGTQIAQGTVTGANISPDAGITAAQVAFGAADIGGVQLLSGTSQPPGTAVGTIWVNPDQGNRISRWDGHVWVPLLFGDGAIEPNSLTAGVLSEEAAIAPGQVNFTARDIGGVTTSLSHTQPSDPADGDFWYDSNDGYALKQWNGSIWALFQFGTNAIAAGSVTAALIAANTITAEQIAAGTIVAGMVDGTVISGAQFVAYGLAGEVLVYSGLPAPGNLVGSWSAGPGIDDFTNQYPAGLTIGQNTTPQIVLSQDGNGAYVTLPTNQADEADQVASIYSLITNPGMASQQLAMLISSMASQVAAADPNQWNILMSAGADDGSQPSSLTIFDGYDIPFLAMQNPGGADPLLLIGQSPSNGAMQFMPVLLNGAILSYGSSAGGQAVQSWSKPGTYSFTVPAGVTAGKIEAIGPGGGGRFGDRNISIGGSGGEYACEPTATLLPGAVATVVVGTGGAHGTFSNTLSSVTNGKDGSGPSTFTCTGTPTVTANPGQGGLAGTTRTPGATGSANTLHHDGGASNGQFGSNQGGAGGGAAGSASGTGAAGISNTGRDPGSGGKGTGLAGSGGRGGWGTVTSAATTAGGNGVSPGGGGGTGGGGSTNAKGSNGGTGGNGLVRITYTNPGSPQIQSSLSSAPATDGSGNTIPAGFQGQIVAVNPSVSPSVPETFHTSAVTLSTSPAYTTFASRPLEVKLNPDNTVTITGALTIPSSGLSVGETIASVTAPYRPSRSQPVYAMALDGSSNGQAVYLEMETTGSLDRFSVYNAGVATLRINGRYPLDG